MKPRTPGSRRSSWLRLAGTAALLIGVLVSLGWTTDRPPPSPDTIRVWNLIAVNALTNSANPLNAPAGPANPPLPAPCAGAVVPVTALHLAMVQGAVYDAVNAIDGGHQPYLQGLPPASPSASKDAAAATAAHDVLVGLKMVAPVPSLCQPVLAQIDALYAASLAALPAAGKADGIAIGAAVAKAMLTARTGDGRFVPFSFTPGTDPGEWRPTASGSDPFAWVANVRPFLLQSPSQLRTAGPHPLTSKAYTDEFREVKALGSGSGSERTPEQTAVALFYTERPDVLWNRTFRNVVGQERLGMVEQARFFAMLNTAGADALISCWNDKAYWSFWRPVTAIQQAATDGNPDTAPDPGWAPLITNPPYPDHPSGYNCITGGFLYTARVFFGPWATIPFTVHSNATNTDRTYNRFGAAIRDVIDARVWQGLHFRTADVQAEQIGHEVAAWLNAYYFQPVH